jgi:hypothetical protein
MKKPTDQELETALDAAERMRERDVDPHYLAHSLLYLYQRNQVLEEVLRRTERFIRFGLPEAELAHLRRLIQRLREEDDRLDEDSELHSSMLL